MQKARFSLDPWGEDRADIRAAIHTASLLLKDAAEKPADDVVKSLILRLQNYLLINHQPEQVISPKQARALMGE